MIIKKTVNIDIFVQLIVEKNPDKKIETKINVSTTVKT